MPKTYTARYDRASRKYTTQCRVPGRVMMAGGATVVALAALTLGVAWAAVMWAVVGGAILRSTVGR